MNDYHRLIKSPLFALGIFFTMLVVLNGQDLIPSATMFQFHDRTQYARVLEYAHALRTWHIPPVNADHMNFGLGYPIFLFYAPGAYIIGAVLHLAQVPIIESVRFVFLMAWISGGIGMFYWQNTSKNRLVSIIASALYTTSPWWASEIFVRGNLASALFLATAPWSLWALESYKRHRIIASLAIGLTLLSHNALSLLWIPILFLYSLIAHSESKAWRSRLIFLILSLVGTAWFWIPSLLQLHLTYAREVAALTRYTDHFLCLSQIWTTGYWGYGASIKGCEDGMSFMIGKIQIILFAIGCIIALLQWKKSKYEGILAIMSMMIIIMTLTISSPLWSILTPLHSLQFPWRLLSLALPFVIAVGASTFQRIPELLSHFTRAKRFPRFFVTYTVGALGISLCLLLIVTSHKFFIGQVDTTAALAARVTSYHYVSEIAAYEVPEYLPRSVDRTLWLSLRNNPPTALESSLLTVQMLQFRPSYALSMFASFVSIMSYYVLWIWLPSKKIQS